MRSYEIIHRCQRGALVRLLEDQEMCKHEFKEVYYGHKCPKCGTFYPHGGAPWDFPVDNEEEEE